MSAHTKGKLSISFKVEDASIKHSAELDKIIASMKKIGIDGNALLPTSKKYRVQMHLRGTYSAFANAIRRTLVEDLETFSLLIKDSDVDTDDDFISGMNDVLVKNLALIPIHQKCDIVKNPDAYNIYINVHNPYNEVLDVKAYHISITKNGKTIPETDLIPDTNISVMQLRPGKYLKVRPITLQKGRSSRHAGKFSLLNNVSYKILDVQPFDQFTGKGQKSFETEPSEFLITFETAGNIDPKHVIELLHKKLTDDLTDIRAKIIDYEESKAGVYYSGVNCEVTIRDDVYTYKFPTHYISETYLIGMCCYKLDPNTPFCSATVDRFDSEIGIIKIKHANPNKLLIAAIDAAIADLDNVLKAAEKINVKD
jgi:hypothetical protein